MKECTIKLKNNNNKKRTVICNDQILLVESSQHTLLHSLYVSTPQFKMKQRKTKQFSTRLQFEP